MTSPLFTIASLLVVLFSIIVHELAHGFMANYLGDPTARLAGRLTLNPIRHLDLFGSIVLPLILFLSNLPIIGWARPVPFNPLNFSRHRRWGTLLVAVVGPLSNVAIALVFALLLQVAPRAGLVLNEAALGLVTLIIIMNISLAVFNLIPIPPLDGHHILFAFLEHPRYRAFKNFVIRYSFLLFIFFFVFIWEFIQPVVFSISNTLIGI